MRVADDQMSRRFLDGAGEKPTRPRRRGSSLVSETVKQAERQSFLLGVRAERMHRQKKQCLYNFCEDCGTRTTTLELHHVIKRSQGQGFRRNETLGVDAPENLELLCRPCHTKKESNPEFSGDAA